MRTLLIKITFLFYSQKFGSRKKAQHAHFSPQVSPNKSNGKSASSSHEISSTQSQEIEQKSKFESHTKIFPKGQDSDYRKLSPQNSIIESVKTKPSGDQNESEAEKSNTDSKIVIGKSVISGQIRTGWL